MNKMKTPLGNFISFFVFSRRSAKGHYNKQKLAASNSGEQLVQWIKFVYSHKGSNKRGLRRRLLHVKAEDITKERHKTSCSTSQAFFQHQPRQEPPAEVDAEDAIEEGLMELGLARTPRRRRFWVSSSGTGRRAIISFHWPRRLPFVPL